MNSIIKYRNAILLILIIIFIRYIFVVSFYLMYQGKVNDGREIINQLILESLDIRIDLVNRVANTFEDDSINKCERISDIGKEKIIQILDSYVKSTDLIGAAYIGTEENVLYGLYNHTDMGKIKFKEERWYKDAKNIGRVVFNHFVNEKTGENYGITSYPILNENNKFLGVLAIEFDKTVFKDIIEKYETSDNKTTAYVYDLDGDVIYKSVSNDVLYNAYHKIYRISGANWYLEIMSNTGKELKALKYMQPIFTIICIIICILAVRNIIFKHDKNKMKRLVICTLVTFVLEIIITISYSFGVTREYANEYGKKYIEFELQNNATISEYEDMKIKYVSSIYEKMYKDNILTRENIIEKTKQNRKDDNVIVNIYYVSKDEAIVVPNNNIEINDDVLEMLKHELEISQSNDENSNSKPNPDPNEIFNLKMNSFKENERIKYKKLYNSDNEVFGMVAIHYIFKDTFEKLRESVNNYSTIKFKNECVKIDNEFNVYYLIDGKEVIAGNIKDKDIREQMVNKSMGNLIFKINGVKKYIVYIEKEDYDYYDTFDYTYKEVDNTFQFVSIFISLIISVFCIMFFTIKYSKKSNILIHEEKDINKEINKDINILKENDGIINKNN